MRKLLTSARRHWRLRSATALAAVGAMTVSLGVVLLGATTAQVNAEEPCVPQDAWTEVSGWVSTSPGPGWYQVASDLIPGTDPVPEVVEYEFRLLTKPAVVEVTENDDTWYSYNPGKDRDENVETGWPVGDDALDKANGWQVNSGNHQGQYEHDNFTVGEPWEEGAGSGSWFFVSRTVVVITPGSPAQYDYIWALESPGGDWEATGNSRVVREYVPGTQAVTVYKFAFDHPRVTCDDTPPPPPPPTSLEELTPAVNFTDATCDTLGEESWDGTLEAFLDYEATGEVGPGETISVEATIESGYADEYEFAEGAQTEFTHTFADITLEDCVQGEETIIPKPKPEKPKPVVEPEKPTVKGVQVVAPPAAAPTAVAAGLAGDSGTATAQLLGQVLAGLGLVMLVAAGWGAPRRVRGAHQS